MRDRNECEDKSDQAQCATPSDSTTGGMLYGAGTGSGPVKQSEPDYRLQRAQEQLLEVRTRELTQLREVLAGVVPAVNRFVNNGGAHTMVSGETRQAAELAANHLGVVEQLRQLRDVISYSGIK